MTTIIVQTISRLMVPFIQLFGLYIIMHGLVSPGGGFQGGVIVGASMIVLALSYDLSSVEARASHKIRSLMDSAGALLFGGIGFLGLLAGGAFLEYDVIPLPMTPVEVSEIMILLVGVAIGIHIMAVVVTIFISLGTGGEEPA